MRYLGVVLLTLCIIGTISAQTGSGTSSSSNGWSAQQSLQDADAIVVGTLISGSGIDAVSKVQVTGVLRARRVLKGDLSPAVPVSVAWEYAPHIGQTPDITSKVPRVTGIWLLKTTGPQTFRPLPVMLPDSMGGVYLPVPDADLPLEYDTPPGTAPAVQLAAELGAALDAIAKSLGDKLNPQRTVLPNGGVRFGPGPRTPFSSLAELLWAIEPASARSVFERLAASPLPNLRTVGLAGLLRAGDRNALLALERDTANLAPTLEVFRLGQYIDRRLAPDLESAQVLARTALADVELPNFEGSVARTLGWVRRVEILPYLAVMLESPSNYTRVNAIEAFCTALRPSSPLQSLWKPEMEANCPNSYPLRNPGDEPRLLAFWKGWWQDQRRKLEETSALPQVRVPARYWSGGTPPQVAEEVPVPMEQRFSSLVNMIRAFKEGGGAGPAGTPLTARLSKTDDQALDRIVTAVHQQLDAQDQEARDMINAARVQGSVPPLEQMQKLNAERTRILQQGLETVKRELSPQGWTAVEAFLNEMNIHGVRLTSPAKPPGK